MYAVVSPPDHEQLFAIAEGQDGYFTMAQALDAGFARSTHSYHVKAGNWLREHRGIYRLKRFPATDTGYLALWSLWSRDQQGRIQGVYSHTTALALRDLSDANPASAAEARTPVRPGRVGSTTSCPTTCRTIC